jgi:glycine/D-amino acid oxidase-like deaminating enzyme
MSQSANVPAAQTAFVLGGGIVGACCALALVRRGFDVALIEKDAPGRAASFGNSASIGLASVPPTGPRPNSLVTRGHLAFWTSVTCWLWLRRITDVRLKVSVRWEPSVGVEAWIG